MDFVTVNVLYKKPNTSDNVVYASSDNPLYGRSNDDEATYASSDNPLYKSITEGPKQSGKPLSGNRYEIHKPKDTDNSYARIRNDEQSPTQPAEYNYSYADPVTQHVDYACPSEVKISSQIPAPEQVYTYTDCPLQVPKNETEYSKTDTPQVKGSANNNPTPNEHE